MVVERLSFPKTVAVLFRSRVEAIFVWSWVTTIVCLVLGRGFPPLGPTLLTILSMIFLSVSTYLYNDVIDMDMDALNEAKGKRPLPSKKVTVGEAMKVIYLLGFLGLGIMLTVNLPSFFFALLYNRRLGIGE